MKALIVVLILTLNAVSPAVGQDVDISDPDNARAFLEAFRGKTMKDGFSVPLTDCETDICQTRKAAVIIAMQLAYEKDFKGQKVLAFCLWTGCDDAVQPNLALGCAWSTVMLAAGHLEIADTDVEMNKLFCGQLDPAQEVISRGQAAGYFHAIYDREIPGDFLR